MSLPTFSDEAKIQLRQFLETQLYARAKQAVLESVEVQVLGSTRAVNQVALDLALKQGMEKAFKDLEKLTHPSTQPRGAVTPRPVQKRPTDTEA